MTPARVAPGPTGTPRVSTHWRDRQVRAKPRLRESWRQDVLAYIVASLSVVEDGCLVIALPTDATVTSENPRLVRGLPTAAGPMRRITVAITISPQHTYVSFLFLGQKRSVQSNREFDQYLASRQWVRTAQLLVDASIWSSGSCG